MKFLKQLLRFVSGQVFVRGIFGVDDVLIAAFVAPMIQAAVSKMTAPKGGPTGQSPGSDVSFLDPLTKQPQGGGTAQPLQPQQFQPIQFAQRRY